MNLAAILERHTGDETALISRGQTTSYRELADQVAHYRGGLLAQGIEPGDRVVILCANNWYFVSAYLAVLGVGAVAVPLNPQSPAAELIGQIASIDACAGIVGPAARANVDEIDRSEVPNLRFLVGCGFDSAEGLSHTTLLAADPAPIVEREDDDLAVMVFTSGTAGAPKAAMLTHGNLRSNIAQMLSAPGNEQTADDVVFGLLPMFHIFGLNVVLGVSLVVGASILLVERFDPASALDAIEMHGVTAMSGPPTMWAAFAAMPRSMAPSFATVRLAVSGAARLADETAVAIREKFGLTLSEGYGLTEASPVVTSAAGIDAPLGSVGVPVPGLEVRLVDGDSDDVPVGDSGELWVRGPNVFAGYWRDDAATAEAIDADGWLHTGDVATVDDGGNLYLVDRVKDLIIVSGFNVYPAEVEEVLMAHPAIDSCAVVGVPHPYTGEAVKAYVVAERGVSVEEDEIVTFCATRLARYKCPAKVWFVDEVPRGLTGKVLRRALR